jgi:GTP-binding protein HflX|tara:strand:- start:80455 stop:81756 length:1302 start_codon:yes stop_codon:yes gene_type:complete
MFDVREKPKFVERALLVGAFLAKESEDRTITLLEELEELVTTLGINIGGTMLAKVRQPNPKLLVGTGKADEIIARALAEECDCIVFDAELTPGQQRNWEALSKLCVIDRQEVILDIFRERAQTKEAVLQVELARAQHSLPRLKNAWTHLSRQRGGGGVTQRGEGEAQIELDQRMVRDSIAALRKELDVVVKQRHVQRHQRQRVPLPTGAIVGYTNAGKSTLLNRLTGADVVVEDKLFATLDPTTRQLILPRGQKLLLTDTVGFVRRLPHSLIEAFKATLEESVQSDFLIHVLDLTNPDLAEHFETTCKVLEELGVGEKPSIYVYNKVDGLDLKSGELPAALVGSELPTKDALFVSAMTGDGIPALLESIEKLLSKTRRTVELLVPHSRYDIINKLHQAGAIRHEDAKEDGVHIVALIPPSLEGLITDFCTTVN